MDFLNSLQAWHWLALGLFIFILEMLGTGGFLLGMGAAALALALTMFIFPDVAWYWQLSFFAILSIAFTLIYWKKFRKFNNETEQPLLNDRVQRLIGRRVSLITPITNGSGKVQIEDALWSVICEQELEQGSIVTIVSAEGATLYVEPYNKQAEPHA